MIDNYDRQGNPITFERWGELWRDKDYQSLAKTRFGNVLVSTVWLGIDHAFGEGTPLIFETMVFGLDEDEIQERYPTEAEAFAGHERIVALVKEKLRTKRYQ